MTGIAPAPTRLARSTPAPPVRIVHLGLGAFSRSHLAWYTQHAADGSEWGISAYTGRSQELADALEQQDGLYTLVERDATGDHFETITSIVSARAGDDVAAFKADVAAPGTAIITLTITEVGYRLAPDGEPDTDDPIMAGDLDLLSAIAAGRLSVEHARPRSALGRLILALDARRRRGSGPLAVLSLDNMPDNGGRTRTALRSMAGHLSAGLVDWLDTSVAFPSSSVDRITPRMPESELTALGDRLRDTAPVIAEPFHDWVIQGPFPAGRPVWESAGVRFVDDLAPWEARKLWMLNGAHTLLACLGQLRGHTTVADAIADPVCRARVELLWDEDVRCLPPGLDTDTYRHDLLRRFANPRIEHRLEQIATDSATKMRLRIVPVAELLVRQDDTALGCAGAIAAWLTASRRGIVPAAGPSAEGDRSVSEMMGTFSALLGSTPAFVDAISTQLARLNSEEPE